MIFFKGSTAYELQIGKFCARWRYLMGGNWKHIFQLDRFKFYIDRSKDPCHFTQDLT